MSWNCRDKNGKFRSRRAYKQDASQDSEEPWEQNRRKNTTTKGKDLQFIGKSKEGSLQSAINKNKKNKSPFDWSI